MNGGRITKIAWRRRGFRGPHWYGPDNSTTGGPFSVRVRRARRNGSRAAGVRIGPGRGRCGPQEYREGMRFLARIEENLTRTDADAPTP